MNSPYQTSDRFPVREVDGVWQVHVSVGMDNAQWLACETKEEARQLANAPVLWDEISSGKRMTRSNAAELDATAEVMEKYGMTSGARDFRHSAEQVRDADQADEFN